MYAGDVIVNVMNTSETYTLTAAGAFDANGLWVPAYGFKLFVLKQGALPSCAVLTEARCNSRR